MTTPLSQEQRVELVAKAKAATPGPWAFECGDHSHRYSQVIAESERTIHYKYGSGTAKAADQDERDAAFIAAANPEAILSYEATVQALTVERDEALERVKVLEAGLADASLGLQAIAEFWNRHADYMDVMSALHRMIDRATTTRESLALLTPKDPGHGDAS
jgi:hypothetical protein